MVPGSATDACLEYGIAQPRIILAYGVGGRGDRPQVVDVLDLRGACTRTRTGSERYTGLAGQWMGASYDAP